MLTQTSPAAPILSILLGRFGVVCLGSATDVPAGEAVPVDVIGYASVPRQSFPRKTAVDLELVDQIRGSPAGLSETEEGQDLLAGLMNSKFDGLSPESLASTRELSQLRVLASP